MVKKAIFAFKKATKEIGFLLVWFLIYSFYDPSIFSSHQFRMGFLAMWTGFFYISFYGKIQEMYMISGEK